MLEVGASECRDVEAMAWMAFSVGKDALAMILEVGASERCGVEAVLAVEHGPATVTKEVAKTVSKTTSSAAFGVGKDSGTGSGGPL